MLAIRAEESNDYAAIRQVHTLAFGRPNEADLVDALRHHAALTISLVAVQDGRIVGRMACSPVTITSGTGTIDALGLCFPMTWRVPRPENRVAVGHAAPTDPITNCGAQHLGLGPMAVLPASQRLGIGSQLVEAGLQACRDTNYGVVVVLGHPAYYPRFGFTPAKPHGIVWEHAAPEEAFMVQELQRGALARTRGVVKYRPEFEHV
jgi:putative acetyltransferase